MEVSGYFILSAEVGVETMALIRETCPELLFFIAAEADNTRNRDRRFVKKIDQEGCKLLRDAALRTARMKGFRDARNRTSL